MNKIEVLRVPDERVKHPHYSRSAVYRHSFDNRLIGGKDGIATGGTVTDRQEFHEGDMLLNDGDHLSLVIPAAYQPALLTAMLKQVGAVKVNVEAADPYLVVDECDGRLPNGEYPAWLMPLPKGIADT